ncbi:MAG: hypothetical protein WA755_18450 [Candidatus Acidiferrales bacterium]
MNMARIGLAILLSGFAGSLADWFFAGVLFHDKYAAHPEIWRKGLVTGEGKSVAWSVLLGFVTCGTFVTACPAFDVHGLAAAFRFAATIWLMVPLPLLITNALFVKMHPLNVGAHIVGWLVKLAFCALAVGFLLP